MTASQNLVSSVDLILVINSLYSGGAEKQLLWMARTLVTSGTRCAVFELQCKTGNRRIEALTADVSRAGVSLHRAAPHESYFRTWRRFRQLLRRAPQAVVWTWGYRADSLMLTSSLSCRRPWLSSLRFASPAYVHRGRWLTRLCRRRVSLYVANSWANCEMLEQVCPGTIPICRVVFNAVEELKQKPISLPLALPSPLRIHMLGNIDPGRKGYDHALDIAEQLRDRQWPVEIYVAGRSDSGHWLPDQISKRQLADVMHYVGESADPIAFLRAGHAYLLTSRYEGTPNALLEAMSVGLPAIATRVGDLDRLAVDRKHLRLIPIGGVQEACDAVGEILDDWPEAVAMGQRGRIWCETKFSDLASKEQLLTLWKEAMQLKH